jgi:hypothetical protein
MQDDDRIYNAMHSNKITDGGKYAEPSQPACAWP